MKQFTKQLLLFTLFSIGFYIAMLFIWSNDCIPYTLKQNLITRRVTDGYTYNKIAEATAISKVDILFLGSSHAYRGFDTRIFAKKNLSSFNLGTSSQTIVQTDLLTKKYIPSLKPKLIVWEVYPEGFTSEGIESWLDFSVNYKNDLPILKLIQKFNIKIYNTLIYRYILNVFVKNWANLKVGANKDEVYVKGGYVQKLLSFNKKNQCIPRKIEIKNEQIQAFECIVNRIKNEHIPIIYVFAPIPPSTYRSYTNIADFDSLMQTYGTYFNFNKIMYLNDSVDFYDDNHLNQIGVQKFNTELLDVCNLKVRLSK